MSNRIVKTYLDENGAAITGATGTVRAYDSEGNYFDWSSLTWKAKTSAFTTLDQPLTEEFLTTSIPSGNYYATYDPSTWGTRLVTFLLQIEKSPTNPREVKEESAYISAGATTAPVTLPDPPASGQNVLLLLRTATGGIPTTVPTAELRVESPLPPADYRAVIRTGAWDAVSGYWLWVVPNNSQIMVMCSDYGICGRYQVATSAVTVNTATMLATDCGPEIPT